MFVPLQFRCKPHHVAVFSCIHIMFYNADVSFKIG